MFQFGDPWEVADLYWSSLWYHSGPRIPQKPLLEQSLEQVKITLVYSRMAYQFALKDLAGPETLEILLAIHDAAFIRFGQIDPDFKERIRKGMVTPVCAEHTMDCIEHYYKLAGGLGNLTQPRRLEE